jgi:hypothetical protein
MDDRAEMNKELRRARGWLLGVGILMFVMDMIFVHGVYADRLLSEDKTKITAISAGILAVFVALWWFSKQKPKLCLALGLAAFWGLQLFNAIQDPKSLTQGIIVKIFFTVALVKGLKSASHAEDLRAKLGAVFE